MPSEAEVPSSGGLGLPPRWSAAAVSRYWTRVLIGLCAVIPVTALILGAGFGPVGLRLGYFWGVDVLCGLLAIRGAHLVGQGAGDAPTRRVWRAFAVAIGLSTIGTLAQAVGAFVPGPTAAVLELVNLGCLACALVVIVRVALTHRADRSGPWWRLGVWLDTACVLLCVIVFVSLIQAPGTQGVPSLSNTIVLSGLLLFTAFIGSRLLFGDPPPVGRWAGSVMAVAVILEGLLDPLLSLPDLVTVDEGAIWAVRLVPVVLLSLGPLLQLRGVAAGRTPGVWHPNRYSLVPYLCMVVVFGSLVSALPPLDLRAGGVLVGALALVGLVVVRQLVAIGENTRLLNSLKEALAVTRRQGNRTRALLDGSSDITTLIDARAKYLYCSPAVERLFGYPADTLLGTSMLRLMHPEDRERCEPMLVAFLPAFGRTITFQARFRAMDGSWRWLEISSTNLLDEPDIGGIVSNAREFTETRRMQERLRYEASHDPLTRLANRSLFTERLGEAVERRTDDSPVAVMLVDLDDFKMINDSYGHLAGDRALIELAERLRASVRDSDTSARLGGDEFAVLLPDTPVSVAGLIAQRLLDNLAEPVLIEGRRITLHASVGLAATTDRDPERLLRDADAAMYRAKYGGKGRYVVIADVAGAPNTPAIPPAARGPGRPRDPADTPGDPAGTTRRTGR